jgi:hypothetical protein
MLRVALRTVVAVFWTATTVMDAPPCPDVGSTCSHASLVDVLHAQSRVVETVAVTLAPDAGTDAGTPERAGWHFPEPGAATCETLVPPQAAARTSRSSKTVQKRPL